MKEELKIVESDLREVVRMIKESFGEGYSLKNPGLVQFLMDKIQQEKDRNFNKDFNNMK